MTGIELPIMGVVALIGTVAGAGGTYAVTKHQAATNKIDIAALKTELASHTLADAKAFNEIMRSLGRIEGTLQELKRGS